MRQQCRQWKDNSKVGLRLYTSELVLSNSPQFTVDCVKLKITGEKLIKTLKNLNLSYLSTSPN